MFSQSQQYFYLDSNAVTSLWDFWTNFEKEGRTGDDIQKTPFSKVVLSDYTLDECLTIPHTTNAFKKHLCMFSIYPQIKVFKAITVFDGKKKWQDTSSTKDLFHEDNFLGNVAALRASALVVREGQKSLYKDIANKNQGMNAAALFSHNEQKLGAPKRLTIEEIIDKIILEQNLSPKHSKHDFYQLCMYLYVAKRKRMIKGFEHKNPDRNLNQQIDSYHLSYLPYVGGFITNDIDLSKMAKSLTGYFGPRVAVLNSEKYWKLWLKNHLTELG